MCALEERTSILKTGLVWVSDNDDDDKLRREIGLDKNERTQLNEGIIKSRNIVAMAQKLIGE